MLYLGIMVADDKSAVAEKKVDKVEKKDATIQPQEQSQAVDRPKTQVNIERQSVMKKIQMKNTKETLFLITGSLLVVLAGIVTGWFLSGGVSAQKTTGVMSQVAPGAEGGKMEAGISDEETFRDDAEGTLVEGGIDGEGSYKLERGLGPEKDVALTSTVIDLQSFVGKKVHVWGETITAQRAGWLMDVGKIKVVE